MVLLFKLARDPTRKLNRNISAALGALVLTSYHLHSTLLVRLSLRIPFLSATFVCVQRYYIA